MHIQAVQPGFNMPFV